MQIFLSVSIVIVTTSVKLLSFRIHSPFAFWRSLQSLRFWIYHYDHFTFWFLELFQLLGLWFKMVFFYLILVYYFVRFLSFTVLFFYFHWLEYIDWCCNRKIVGRQHVAVRTRRNCPCLRLSSTHVDINVLLRHSLHIHDCPTSNDLHWRVSSLGSTFWTYKTPICMAESKWHN